MFGIDLDVLIALPFVLFFYFTPAIVATWNKHRHATSIRILNLLAGWTFIGWVAAAVWAYTENNRESKPKKKKADIRLK